uniref:Si:dkey-25g12.4 n=1 Tax=Lates calcarifer TaxID=8187 RepID=A0A4W6D913_LATCA
FSAGTSDLPPTKTITVYRNGDAFYPGRKIVVNPRQVSTLDSFLTTLTRAVEAPFGAVRRLHTPVRGHKVQHLDDLKHGSVYVAAGNEQFKKLECCLVKYDYVIDVFTNGDVLEPPARIRIPKYTLRSWENVLALVTEKVHLRTGAVYRLCTLDGHPICGSTELENNQHYVAVGAEKFKALPYDQCLPLLSTLMGNPHRDRLAHLIKCSEPHRQIICTRGTSLTENKKKISYSNQNRDNLYCD